MFDRSFWPERVKNPYQRLILAMILAPLLWGLLGAAFGFVVAGLSEGTLEDVLDYTLEVTLTALGALFVFTFSLGLIGILLLWAFRQRSPTSWALVGGGMGALVAAIHSYAFAGQFNQSLMIVFVLMGWSLFLTIRWIAGISERRDV